MSETYSVKARLSAVDSGFTSTLNRCSSVLDKIDSKISGLSFGVLMGAGQAAFQALSGGVSGLVGEIDDANTSWKTFAKNMEIIGKNDAIDEVKKSLQEFAQQTVYSSSDMASTYAQLAAVGTESALDLVKAFGGLAAAAENPQQAMKTLSQQATQMAAKPKVAWADFKLMLEQTPAGIAAVADQMGMSAAEMVTAVQDGEIATKAFFDAIIKAGGAGTQFEMLATEAKNMGQAMDGLRETVGNKLTPAFEVLNREGISVIDRLASRIAAVDADGLVQKLTNAINTVKLFGITLKRSFAGVGTEIGQAVRAVASALGAANGEFSKTDILAKFGSGMRGVADVIKTGAGYIEKHADTIASLISMLPKLVVALEGFKVASPFLAVFAGGMSNLSSLVGGVAGSVGTTMAKITVAAKVATGSVSSSLAAVGEKLKGISIDSVSKRAKSGVSALRKGFKNAGASLSGYGESVATALETISTKFSDSGIKVWQAFDTMGSKVTASGSKLSRNLRKHINSAASVLSGFSTKASAVAAPFASVFSGIGKGVQKSASVGMSTLKGMTSALTKLVGVALNSVGPAAIFGMALVGFGALHGAFGGEIDALIQTVTTKGSGIISGLANSITAKIPMLIQTGAQMLSGLLNAVTANLPAVFSAGIQIVKSLVQGVGDNVSTILPAAINLVTAFATGVLGALPQIVMIGMGLLLSLANGVLENAGLIVNSAKNTINSFVSGVVSNLPNIIQTGVQILTSLVQGAVQIIPQLVVTAFSAVSTFISGVASNLPQILQAGVSLVKMLISGIIQNLPMVLQSAIQALSTFVKAVLTNLPSIVTTGGQIIVAAVTGLIRMLPSIVEAGWSMIKALGGAIKEAIPNIITGAVDGIKNIFSDLWNFITGKNKESSEKTVTDIVTMTKDVQSNVAALSANVQNSFASMSSGAVGEASSLMSGVTDSLSGMNSLGSADMSGLAASIMSSASKANESATVDMVSMAASTEGAMALIGSSVNDTMSQLPMAAASAMDGFVNSLNVGEKKSEGAANSITSTVVSSLRSGYDSVYDAGAYISEGFAGGMHSQLASIRSAAAEMAAAADEAVRAKAKIHSPSKLFEGLGEDSGEGYAGGLMNMVNDVWKAAQELISIPAVAAPDLSVAYSGELSSEYSYSSSAEYVIEVPLTVDGREFARATASYTQDELNRRQTRDNRKHGIVYA